MTPLLLLSELLHLDVDAAEEREAGWSVSPVSCPPHTSSPTPGTPSLLLRSPLGLRLLVLLDFQSTAVLLRLHVLQHYFCEAQVPRLQHAGHRGQRGHLMTGHLMLRATCVLRVLPTKEGGTSVSGDLGLTDRRPRSQVPWAHSPEPPGPLLALSICPPTKLPVSVSHSLQSHQGL